jgi:hypothetical protein
MKNQKRRAKMSKSAKGNRKSIDSRKQTLNRLLSLWRKGERDKVYQIWGEPKSYTGKLVDENQRLFFTIEDRMGIPAGAVHGVIHYLYNYLCDGRADLLALHIALEADCLAHHQGLISHKELLRRLKTPFARIRRAAKRWARRDA